MNEAALIELVDKIQTTQAEFQTVEVKRSKTKATTRLYDTLSSFSNQDDGGIIVFGLYKSEGFSVTGVDDVQALQKSVMEQCNEMEPAVRAVFTTAVIEGKNVVSAEIPPVDITMRPCYYKGKGRVKGSFVRVGDSDQHMTEYEVYSYEAYRKKYQDDIRTIERADISSLDKNKLDDYLRKLKLDKPNLSHLDDETIMSLMSIVNQGKPTITAELLFGLYPQAYFPQLGIIAISVPGDEVGDTDIDGSRFIDNQRIEGTIQEMLDGALRFVRNNTKNRTIIDPEPGRRSDKTDYPMNSVREAILNALVHRDYSFHTEGMPIRLTIFSDRLEIQNPGGIYGADSTPGTPIVFDACTEVKNIDDIGARIACGACRQPDTRNPVLATALEVLGVTENRYSGIPTIRRECKEYGLPDVEFKNERGEFTVCFRKAVNADMLSEDQASDLIQFCKKPRTRKEIAKFLGLSSVTYAMNKYVQPLIDKGQIKLTVPEAPSSRKQMYYSEQ